MLQVFSHLPENSEDDDPHQHPAAEILSFNSKNIHEIVYFPITLDKHLSAKAQALIEGSCGDSVLYLDEVPIPKKHQSKIWIGLKAAAFSIALHAIITSLPSAELGLVRHFTPTGLQG